MKRSTNRIFDIWKAVYSFLLMLSLYACSNITDSEDKRTPNSEGITLMALGDSYTIGEAVAPAESWPLQLRDSLISKGIDVERVEVIARTGWTSGDLLRYIEQNAITRYHAGRIDLF